MSAPRFRIPRLLLNSLWLAAALVGCESIGNSDYGPASQTLPSPPSIDQQNPDDARGHDTTQAPAYPMPPGNPDSTDHSDPGDDWLELDGGRKHYEWRSVSIELAPSTRT